VLIRAHESCCICWGIWVYILVVEFSIVSFKFIWELGLGIKICLMGIRNSIVVKPHHEIKCVIEC